MLKDSSLIGVKRSSCTTSAYNLVVLEPRTCAKQLERVYYAKKDFLSFVFEDTILWFWFGLLRYGGCYAICCYLIIGPVPPFKRRDDIAY